ncbi:hypothetical protein VTN77DRAFT_2584 [Rasamsonia byssochlamydoides]|uniref:uncharacterized protein n=1 Tax=Rasamsonia byssochlamydoides TaxID=89139 RepID=UPI003741FD9F
MTRQGNARAAGDIPPVYRINLSLPPYERYVELSRLYRDELRALADLFDELVEAFLPNVSVKLIRGLARVSLRRLFTTEETEEIRGISQAVGVDMYLLVAFNVLLDVLMGCTSGGVRVRTDEQNPPQTKMLHFRTLDWGMDVLRKLIVQLEYVSTADTDEILATSITYVGFVGVLTAVRKGLSVSLNFRPIHDTSRKWANCRFSFSHLLVLLGTRRSISSLLRLCVLPEAATRPASSWTLPWWRRKSNNNNSTISASTAPSLSLIQDRIPSEPTTAAYLIFSDGASTVTMEKDHRTAVVRSSSSFIVITNNDQEPDAPSTRQIAKDKEESHAGLGLVSGELESMADIIAESDDRRACLQAQWDRKVRRAERERARKRTPSRGQPHKQQQSPTGEELNSQPDNDTAATPQEVIKWLSTYPVTNETTHFAAIMDPTEGKVVWVRRYMNPTPFAAI